MLCWTDETTARLFCNLLVSAAAYAAEEHGAFAAFFNPTGQKPELKTLEEMEHAAETLDKAFAGIEGQHGAYLRDMLLANRTFLALLGGAKFSYRDAVKKILGIDLQMIPQQRLERFQDEVDRMLTEDGYRQNTIQEKVAQWYADNALDSSKLVDTARHYLTLLQQETRKMIELPESEGWGKLDLTTNVVWAALSQYQGGYVTNVTMNADSTWKLPNFVDTISHELYPGHHVWYTKREELLKAERYPLEASVISICMADNLIFEGAPESGIHFLGVDDFSRPCDWLDPALRRKICVAKKIIDCIRILQINACCKHYLEKCGEEETVSYMTQGGWIEPSAAKRVYRYFAHPFNGLYYPAYYYGRWIVTYAFDGIAPEQRQEFYRELYAKPHSTATFIQMIKDMTGKPFDPVSMAQQ